MAYSDQFLAMFVNPYSNTCKSLIKKEDIIHFGNFKPFIFQIKHNLK